jgi:hypothetical protein
MSNQALLTEMQAKLDALPLGKESIKVFGAIRCNVHVVCGSRATAAKWVAVLNTMFKDAKVYCGPHTWDAKENKGTCLLPTKREGFLVAVAA